MLEIPESSTLARQLNETAKGKVIRFAKANKSPHKFAWYSGDPDNYDDLLSGKQIGSSISRGSMLEIEAEDCRILLGDGVCLQRVGAEASAGEYLSTSIQLLYSRVRTINTIK